MQKEKILEARKKYKGWNLLFDMLEETLTYVTTTVPIKEITTRHGMLNVTFEESNITPLTYLMNSLSYRLERDSVKICVVCGNRGIRRNNLESGVYCFDCWVINSNNVQSSSGE